jgi:hypothetical protein
MGCCCCCYCYCYYCWCCDCCCVIKRVTLCEREVLSTRAFYIVRSSIGCEDQPCSWVRREGRDREDKKEVMLTESTYKNCMLHLNIL